ncbi:hypothetical protein L3V83_08180 [Thiotrichales bacterium 19X7-9]|nr:hypothetical protein [Thiotrichales bacterium 19X7-9]
MPYIITAFTWNIANQSPTDQTIKHLSSKLAEISSSDLIVFSLQEAKNSELNKNAGERITELLNANITEQQSQYSIIYNDNFRVITKPTKPSSYLPNMPRTALIIAAKKSITDKVIIDRKASGIEKHVNKGGLYASIRIENTNLAVISIHLSSNSKENRKCEIQQLLNHFPEGTYDALLIGGDFNERIDLNDTSDPQLQHLIPIDFSTIRKDEANLIKSFDPIRNDRTYLSKQDLKFCNDIGKPTYVETDQSGSLKYKYGHYYFGVLDQFGYKGNCIMPSDQQSMVIQLDETRNHTISDHKPVIQTYILHKPENTLDKIRLDIENKAKQEGFDLSLGYSGYKITIDHNQYMVPKRIYDIYNILNSPTLSDDDKKDQINKITEKSHVYQSPNFLFSNTTSKSTNQFIESLALTT